LAIAAQDSHSQISSLLLKQGADLNMQDIKSNRTDLMKAAMQGFSVSW
jgi:hypothetical protein